MTTGILTDWAVLTLPAGINVLPVDDSGYHSPHRLCRCKPEFDSGVIVHNSFDGREPFETGERKVS